MSVCQQVDSYTIRHTAAAALGLLALFALSLQDMHHAPSPIYIPVVKRPQTGSPHAVHLQTGESSSVPRQPVSTKLVSADDQATVGTSRAGMSARMRQACASPPLSTRYAQIEYAHAVNTGTINLAFGGSRAEVLTAAEACELGQGYLNTSENKGKPGIRAGNTSGMGPAAVPRIIFMYWNMGWNERTPELVHLASMTWLLHNPSWSVVRLSDATLSQWLDTARIPGLDNSSIDASITIQAKSDIIRVHLLARPL